MAIEIICSCGTRQHVPNSSEGTDIKCIHCGRMVLATLQPQTPAKEGAPLTLSERRMELENYSLTVKFQPDVAGEVEPLLKLVAANIGMNAAAAEGMKVKAGWSILTIRRHIQDLTLYEPDFSGDPHRESREDVSLTLRMIAVQSRVSQMIPGVRLLGCTCFDTLQVPDGVFHVRKLFLRRIKAPTHSESGLYISSTDPLEALKSKQPEPTHNRESYLLLKERSAMIQVLGLPTDHIAEFDGNELVTIYGGPKNKILWKAR